MLENNGKQEKIFKEKKIQITAKSLSNGNAFACDEIKSFT